MVVFAFVAAVLHFVLVPIGGDDTPITVVVSKGATARSIAENLADKKLIHLPCAFVFAASSAGLADKLKPGAYKFTRKMSVRQMVDAMADGDMAAIWVTIPEGFTVNEIANRLAEKTLVDKEEFLAAAQSITQDYSKIIPLPGPGLEGYLFPDTYLVSIDGNSEEIISTMLKGFKNRVYDPYSKEIVKIAGSDDPKLCAETLKKIIIIASMIEREAKVDKDRPLISAVIWNRLKLGMRLEIDATVNYAAGVHYSRLYYQHINSADSPYNTYKHRGLPPGPIANPGLPSIKAAMNPAKVNYLYYVAKPDGSHIFTNTLADHNAAKASRRNGG